MKIYSVLISLVIIVFSGCKFLPVTTKDGTIDAAIGKWEHQGSKKSNIKAITFSKMKDSLGDSVCITQFQPESHSPNKSAAGTWRYAGIGKIEIFDRNNAYWVLKFSLVDRSEMFLFNDDEFIKDK